MKSIKKFSATSNKGTSILESATLTPEALADLVKKLGYNNIDEIKKEKALLSKLESLLKEVNPKEDISEDDAEDIEDKVNSLGEPKSLEDKSGNKEEDDSTKDEETEVSEEDEEEDTSKEIEDDIVDLGEPEEKEEEEGETVVTNNQEITDEVEEETEKKPVATRRIMTFEDFIKEEDVTVNKNVSYQDDEEEDEDDALPVADSVDTAKEVKESDTVENSPIKSFSKFVSESYLSEEADNGPELKDEEVSADNVVVPIAKGDGTKSADEIAAKLVAMGKPEKKNSKEGEDLVTKDQEITEEPKTAKEVNEGKEFSFTFDYNTDEDDIEYIQNVLKKAGVNATAGVELDSEEMVVKAANAIELRKAKKAIEADGFQINEDHFKVGDKVKMSHGGTGVIKSLDKESGADNEKYYNVELPNGDMMKHAPNELTKVMTEAKVNEADIKSDAEFKEYAEAILKKAHGDDYDEAKAKEVIDGLKSKYKEDFGAMVGALQSTMG